MPGRALGPDAGGFPVALAAASRHEAEGAPTLLLHPPAAAEQRCRLLAAGPACRHGRSIEAAGEGGDAGTGAAGEVQGQFSILLIQRWW